MKSKKKKNFEWERQFQSRQKRINAFARQYLCPGGSADTFVVMHPEEYRRFLRKGPCGDCPVSHFCNSPCRVYLKWYDTRMELFRGRLGKEGCYAGIQ